MLSADCAQCLAAIGAIAPANEAIIDKNHVYPDCISLLDVLTVTPLPISCCFALSYIIDN
jgi:hypothetical protein